MSARLMRAPGFAKLRKLANAVAALLIALGLLAAPAHASTDPAARGLASRALRSAETVITSIAPAPVAGVVALNHPTVTGKAPPLSAVTVLVNGTAVGTTTANATGAWQFTLPAQLNGSYTLLARATPASGAFALKINDPAQPLTDYLSRPAVFDLNMPAGIYYSNGTQYASSADLLSGLGATTSGITSVVGPFVDPQAANLVTNGTFDSATTGWATDGSGSIASVSGQLQFTLAATGDSVRETPAISGYAGRALAFSGTGARGTNSGNSPFPAMTQQNTLFGGNNVTGAALASTTQAPFQLMLSGVSGGNTYVGVKGSSGAGTTLWDNFAVREAMPLPGWIALAATSTDAAGAFSVVLDAVTPAAAPGSGVKVLWQADTGTDRDRVRVHWAADGHLHAVYTFQNTAVQDFDLGVVATSTRFKVALAMGVGSNGDRTTGYAVSLNGGDVVSLFTSSTPAIGVSVMRTGRDVAGASLWDGTVRQVSVVQGRAPLDWLELQAAQVPANSIVGNGDSYMDGNQGISLKASLAAATGRNVVNLGVGGSTFAAQRNVYLGKPYLRGVGVVHWDGSDNGTVDVATDVSIAQAILAFKGDDKVLWVMPLAVPNPAAPSANAAGNGTRAAQRLAAFTAAFGSARVFDPLPVLQALSTGSADDAADVNAGLAPRSVLYSQDAGQVHLSAAAMTAVANAIAASGKLAGLAPVAMLPANDNRQLAANDDWLADARLAAFR